MFRTSSGTHNSHTTKLVNLKWFSFILQKNSGKDGRPGEKGATGKAGEKGEQSSFNKFFTYYNL